MQQLLFIRLKLTLLDRISQHHYSAIEFCNGSDIPLASFMNKQGVRGNLTIFSADIAETHRRGLAYVLGCVAFSGLDLRQMLITTPSETSTVACHGEPGLSNTAGAALWTIDYALQAATLGIKELFFHEGIGFPYNFVSFMDLTSSFAACSYSPSV